MPASERVLAIVRDWMRKADNDLTNAAHIASDHVHEDAEKIEHVLGEEVVRQLERRLEHATRDPHGRLIPSLADVQKGMPTPAAPREETGYGARP